MRRYIMLISCTFMLWIGGVSMVHAADAIVGIVRSDNSILKQSVAPDQALSIGQVEDMVRAAVKLAGGLEQVLKPDAKVVAIKPNLVEVKRSGDGTITDWRVVRAIAKIAHEIARNAKVKVVECCNWDVPDTDWKQDGWAYAGYRNLETESYIELVNMNYDSTLTRAIPGGGTVRDEYKVSETMMEVDCFIDVPVVKIIGVVSMTAAMKNLVGMVPMKGYEHRTRLIPHTRATLDEAIVDLNLLHRVDFVVSDLIVGMERAKTSSWGGQPVRMNTILASPDVVAVDAVSAQVIGLNPDDVEYLTLAQMRGIGVEDPDRIEVRGEDLSKIARRFEKMPTDADQYGQTPKIWTIKGPFPAKEPKEEFLDPSTLSVVPGEDGWSGPLYFSSDNIDLKKQLGKPRNCIVYAYTDFTAPRDEPAELWVGSGEAMTIWIDGKEVYRFEGRRKHRVPSDKKRIQLTRGRHGLLVKGYQTFGAFDFSLNICETEDDPRYAGNRVKGLKFIMPEGVKATQLPTTKGEAEMELFDIVDWVTQETFSIQILKSYGSKEGLPSGRVEGIALDLEGRLWVAMRNGIYHQTGDTTWTAYTKDNGLPVEGWVGSLVVHPANGDAWAVIRGRLLQFTDGKWEQHFPDVWHGNVYVDANGVVWTASFRNGVRCYDGRDWKSYKILDEEKDWLNDVECVQPDAKGNIWIGMWGRGAGRFDGNAWKVFMVRDGLADNHARVVRIAPNDDVWVGFYCPGISRYNGKKWKSFYDNGAPNEETASMLITRNGVVWVATQDETLSHYDGKRWATATCTHSIQDMLEDREGRIWMAAGPSVVVTSLK